MLEWLLGYPACKGCMCCSSLNSLICHLTADIISKVLFGWNIVGWTWVTPLCWGEIEFNHLVTRYCLSWVWSCSRSSVRNTSCIWVGNCFPAVYGCWNGFCIRVRTGSFAKASSQNLLIYLFGGKDITLRGRGKGRKYKPCFCFFPLQLFSLSQSPFQLPPLVIISIFKMAIPSGWTDPYKQVLKSWWNFNDDLKLILPHEIVCKAENSGLPW